MMIQFLLNKTKVSVDIEPGESLLSVLRRLGCHSLRSGCETTNCGICTVWVDDKPILSCAYPAARAEGKAVTTIEGLRTEADALVRIMAEEGAEQCGFCSPGFLMTVLAMVRELPDPTDDEIKAYLAGNLCRCTGYAAQHRAIRRYYQERRRANG